jgi:NitT/TauT family transport system ATP-binding protein
VDSGGGEPQHRAHVSVRGVSKQFSTAHGGAALALRSVDLEIPAGRFISVVGPSGCGKSTLLQIIGGLMPASGGEVYLEGARVDSPPFDVIYVFQQYSKSIFPWKTVAENVAFGLKNRTRLDARAIREQCAEYIELVGLKGYEHYYPWQLSGGMQQRVAIARALVCRPKVLLMDEPFSSVDALTRSGLQDFLLRIWADFSLTVAFVTHDIEEAIYLSQKVVVLSKAPASVMQAIDIELPYPRNHLSTKEHPRYLAYRHRIFEQVFA